MSIFTCLRDRDLPTAAKLQRIWGHCIIAGMIRDCGGWPSTTIEWRLRRYGAGAVQASRGIGLTATESSVDRLKRSIDVALWVHGQICALGALRFGIAYFSYVEDLDACEIGAIIEAQPRVVLDHRLVTARHLNRCVKHAAKQAGIREVV